MIKIQISNPKVLSVNEAEGMNLEDAIEAIFPLETEDLILIWNNILIPLTYKYDVSLMALDFIKIVHYLHDEKNSHLDIHWASNSFACIWKMKKIHNVVHITSEWRTVIGNTEKLLNTFNENTLLIQDMQQEVKKLLTFLKISLEKSGLPCHKIQDFELLEKSCT